MKRILSLIALVLLFASCEEEIRFNNPGMQGLKDDVFWRAEQVRGNISSTGVLTLTGSSQGEALVFTVESANVGAYQLGVTNNNKVSYNFDNGAGFVLSYSTGEAMGQGEIKITEYDNVNKTISGKFKFNALTAGLNSSGNPILNFQYGEFYKVPVDTN